MTKPRAILLCTADIAVHYRVSVGTVRRWACEDHWHPYRTRRFRMWNIWDAQASYDRRHHSQEDCA